MRIIELFLFAVLFSSCLLCSCRREWLDVKASKTLTVPTALKDFQSLLDLSGTIMNASAIPLGEIAADGHYVTESAWTTATSSAARNAYTWSNNEPYLNVLTWAFTYQRILRCNIVLDGLKNVSVSSPVEKRELDNIKGQALFSRADAFHMLAQIYAKPYNAGTANADLGIPLRLGSDITEKSTRASVRGTYDQIINDLKEAEHLLPIVPVAPTRGSMPSLYALLARVYLTMEQYDSTLKYSDLSLKLYDKLLDFNNLATNKTFIGGFNTDPANPEVIFHSTIYTSGMSGFLTTNYLVDVQLYEMYDENDLRRDLYFRRDLDGTIRFKGNYFNSTSSIFVGLATDEVLLMRAECYARKGNTQLAMNDLNLLMKNRWRNTVPFVDFVAADKDAALEIVLRERRKELILRNTRWFDLRRLNMDNRFKVTINRTIGGKNFSLEPNSFRYVFPIPEDIISISNIPQNPGWE